jgi:hypothetical protein
MVNSRSGRGAISSVSHSTSAQRDRASAFRLAGIKRRARGPPFSSNCYIRTGCPGRAALHPGEKSLLGLLGLLCLLRLFRLLRFLSHSILIWVDGWKRDTRHARRRANLATSSNTIRTDSRAAAPHCHGGVIALSTVVMHFDMHESCWSFLNPDAASRLQAFQAGRQQAPFRRFDALFLRSQAPAIHEIKTTVQIGPFAVRVR